MALQLIGLLGIALLLLAGREYALYLEHERGSDRLRKDREVAQLEDLWDLDWTQP